MAAAHNRCVLTPITRLTEGPFMSTFTVYGTVVDVDGVAVQTGIEGRSMRLWPSANFRDRQADHIGVHLGHVGPELGEVHHLEHRDRHLWAVASIDFDRADERDVLDIHGPLYFSPSVSGRPADSLACDDIELAELSLTDRPAGHALQPVRLLCGDIRSSNDRGRWPYHARTNPLLVNAVDTVRSRSVHRSPLHIRRHHPDPVKLDDGLWLDHTGRPVPVPPLRRIGYQVEDRGRTVNLEAEVAPGRTHPLRPMSDRPEPLSARARGVGRRRRTWHRRVVRRVRTVTAVRCSARTGAVHHRPAPGGRALPEATTDDLIEAPGEPPTRPTPSRSDALRIHRRRRQD